MSENTQNFGFTGNQLKIIAMIAMTIDHIGMILFPREIFFRIVGRLALPVYAYMIAEGCRHTRDRKKYFLRLFTLGLLCQVVYFFAMGSIFQCILITFSLSVLQIFSLDFAKKRGGLSWLLPIGLCALIWFITTKLRFLLPGTDFDVDYRFWGVMLPVLVWLGKTHWQKTALFTIGLLLLANDLRYIQWWGLAAVPLLALYNGQRGKWNIGKLFYFYYPLHLVVIYGLSIVL